MISLPVSRVQSHNQPIPSLPSGYEVQNGTLFYKGIDLMSFIERPLIANGRIDMPTTPMYIRHLPSLRDNFMSLRHWFDVAKAQTGFPGELTIAYASKANPSEPVARTVLQMGAAHECSSRVRR